MNIWGDKKSLYLESKIKVKKLVRFYVLYKRKIVFYYIVFFNFLRIKLVFEKKNRVGWMNRVIVKVNVNRRIFLKFYLKRIWYFNVKNYRSFLSLIKYFKILC